MRTEQQLRDALASAADQAPAAEPVLQKILPRRSPTMVRRRRTALILAAAFLAVLAVALPTFLVNRSAVPADPPVPSNTRTSGNWNSVFRVDLEPGWRIVSREVRATTEDMELLVPIEGEPYPDSCFIQVTGPGEPAPTARPGRSIPVDVYGRPGLQQGGASEDEPAWLYWPYEDNAWAQLSCPGGAAQNLQVARRMVFEPTPVRVPLRLRSLPAGYRVSSVGEESYPESSIPATRIGLTGRGDGQGQPGMWIEVYRGAPSKAKPGTPGNWVGSVNGLSAVFDADARWLGLTTQGHEMLLETDGGMSNLPRARWPEAFRDLLVDIAGRVDLAEDLASPADWPDANQALPS